MMDLGLVGCGAVVHEMYAKSLVGRAEFSARYLFDIDEDQAASAMRVLGGEVVPLAELYAKSDAVIITTPPSSHAQIVRESLRPNRIILCEKPFVTAGDEAASLINEARSVGARLYVGQFRRSFANVSTARTLVSLGLIGDVTGFSASEGGRFTWNAASGYTVDSPFGGVLWDTGAHTLDMALFASGLDRFPLLGVEDIRVEKDKSEPSHDFLADFDVRYESGVVRGHLHLSRLEALPGLIKIHGTGGELAFSAGMDDRVRLRTAHGSIVIPAEHSSDDLLQYFDLQLRRILLSEGDQDFSADNFVGQIQLLEALSRAG